MFKLAFVFLDILTNSFSFSLMTNQLNANGDICVDFWYHMYGPHVNTLRLETQFSSNRNDRRSQWSASGDKGNQWLQLRRTVTIQNNNRVRVASETVS